MGSQGLFDGSLKGRHILVVDDIRPNIVLIQAYFEILGCTGDYAKNGVEAVQKVSTQEYDLCLMDFQMPVMGGIEATRVIRQTLKKNLPIIALTGSATIEDLKEGMRIGMNDSCTKPVAIEELARVMLRVLSQGVK